MHLIGLLETAEHSENIWNIWNFTLLFTEDNSVLKVA